MRKEMFFAVLWILVLIVPSTAVALGAVAYVDLHFSVIAQAISDFEHAISSNGAGLVSELSARFPEILGMAIGMIVIFTIYAFTRQSAQPAERNKK